MFRLLFLGLVSFAAVTAFHSPMTTILSARRQGILYPYHTLALSNKSSNENHPSSSSSSAPPQQAFAVGTFVEFEEKKRTHIGKISAVEHKSSGGARYRITDAEGKAWDVADKQVTYAMPCPNAPGPAQKLFEEFVRAQDAPLATLQEKLEMTPELLEMAWEETADTDETESHVLTAAALIELVQGHAASAMEKYLAWQLLKTDMAHVFFKEIKDHGRVVAFKAKTRKAVEAAKEAFCQSHQDSDLCFVV